MVSGEADALSKFAHADAVSLHCFGDALCRREDGALLGHEAVEFLGRWSHHQNNACQSSAHTSP